MVIPKRIIPKDMSNASTASFLINSLKLLRYLSKPLGRISELSKSIVAEREGFEPSRELSPP